MRSTGERTQQRARCWVRDGWHGSQSILVRAYRKPVRTGHRGRPRLVVAETLTLTPTVKHGAEHGRLVSVEIRTVLGAQREPTGTVQVERLHALTRKTHAFAKRDATFDALVGVQLFDHTFHRAHRVLRLPLADGVYRYYPRSPAMALGLTDQRWSFLEVLTTRIPITP